MPGFIAKLIKPPHFRVRKPSSVWLTTLESGIDVAPWINVASGKFDKKNKRSPLKCANLCSKVEVF